MNLKKLAERVLQGLVQEFPEPRVELDHSTPLQLLVATILSAQCTDARVNRVTRGLFRKYQRPEDYLKAGLQELEEDVRPTGFYRQKAKKIRGAMQVLVDEFEGEVPGVMDDLLRLPGVGRKTANLILGIVFQTPGIVVDTHMRRVANRIGLSAEKDPEKIERALMKLLSRRDWTRFSLAAILHGRYVCKARNPLCERCGLTDCCDFYLSQST